MSAFGAAAAVAGLAMREAMRQRLWLAFVVAGIALAAAAAGATAVDESAKLKLGVVIVTAGMGFAAVLLAAMLAAAQLRRDLDAKVAITLFSKPLARGTYLLGRFAGAIAWLGVGLAALAALGALLIAWRFGAPPQMRRVAEPVAWTEVSSLGEAVPARAGRDRLSLAGPPGNAVRWHLQGLPPPGPEGLELLLRAEVRSNDPDLAIDRAAVQVLASADGARWELLALDPASPYGRLGDGAAGRVGLRSNDPNHQDLSQDYCRLRLGAASVSTSGESWVQVVRLEGGSTLVVDRLGSCYAAVPGGAFALNLERAALVLLAQAALLCAFTLFVATVAGLPVALLGGLTLYFAGNALWALRETLEYGDPSLAATRLIHLALAVVPDFDRYGVAAQLAAGQAVGWDTVASAGGYYGAYAAVFLLAGWIALARSEL